MHKSYGLEYFVIVAAMAASLSVPVFANSLVSVTDEDTATTAPMAGQSTVRSLGTLHESDMQNPQGMQPAGQMDQDRDESLQPLETNGIKYISGGIGDEERATLDSMKRDFNLHITSAGTHGEFVGNTRIIIADGKGNELVNAPAAGPLFYAELPPGTYTLEARSNGEKQVRRITAGNRKPLFVHLTWQ